MDDCKKRRSDDIMSIFIGSGICLDRISSLYEISPGRASPSRIASNSLGWIIVVIEYSYFYELSIICANICIANPRTNNTAPIWAILVSINLCCSSIQTCIAVWFFFDCMFGTKYSTIGDQYGRYQTYD